MVYTTGGMRVARVSVVDGSGKEVFDELIKMDDGVEVMSVMHLSQSTRIDNKGHGTVTTTHVSQALRRKLMRQQRNLSQAFGQH